MANTSTDILAAIDAGSSKVLCVIARPSDALEGCFKVLGFGRVPSQGIKNGIIYDVEKAVFSIRTALQEAQNTAGVSVRTVWPAIGGSVVTSANARGVAVLRGREVRQEDVDEAVRNAYEHCRKLAGERNLLKTRLQGYRVGEVEDSQNPVGLMGESIEAHMHAVFSDAMSSQTLRATIQRAGVEVGDYSPQPWASARAVIRPDDAACGAAVIDMGADTTSFAVYTEGALRYTDVIPWGAQFFTKDLASVLDITIEQAEEIKLLRGTCLPERVNDWESVVPTPENGRRQRAYSRRLMATVLKARADEFLRHYRKLLEERGDLGRVRTVVLTGGGANLAGLTERALDIFPGKTVRVGLPNNIDGAPQLINQPDASVVMGLIGEASDKVAGKGERQLLNLSAPGFLQNLKNVLIGDY